MTVSEFEKWSRFASEIRDKTIAGEILFDEYYTEAYFFVYCGSFFDMGENIL